MACDGLCGAASAVRAPPLRNDAHTCASTAALDVAERFAERQRWATGWRRGTRGYVATRAEGGRADGSECARRLESTEYPTGDPSGRRGADGQRALPDGLRSTHSVLTEYPTRYPSRRRGADGSERSPTAAEARTKYSQSTPRGTREGKGERTGSICTADRCGAHSFDPRTNTRTRTRNWL